MLHVLTVGYFTTDRFLSKLEPAAAADPVMQTFFVTAPAASGQQLHHRLSFFGVIVEGGSSMIVSFQSNSSTQ